MSNVYMSDVVKGGAAALRLLPEAHALRPISVPFAPVDFCRYLFIPEPIVLCYLFERADRLAADVFCLVSLSGVIDKGRRKVDRDHDKQLTCYHMTRYRMTT